MQIHHQNIYVILVYQGHRAKVKVTGAKSLSVCPVAGDLPWIEHVQWTLIG